MLDDQAIEPFNFDEIAQRYIPGITKVQVAQHIQACIICLDHNSHRSGVELAIKMARRNDYIRLHWDEIVDDQMRRAWADLQEATEYGATAIAILLVLRNTEYTIIQRTAKGPGFDYWLLEEKNYDENDPFPEGTARLEISGMIDSDKDSEIKARVRDKIKQTEKSDNMKIPAVVVVVAFHQPEAHLVRKS